MQSASALLSASQELCLRANPRNAKCSSSPSTAASTVFAKASFSRGHPVYAMCRLDDEAYSDDEDTSWKVRRAAAKTVAAVVVSYPQLLPQTFAGGCPVLVARFREREENVKADVFSTFSQLLQQASRSSRLSSGTALLCSSLP